MIGPRKAHNLYVVGHDGKLIIGGFLRAGGLGRVRHDGLLGLRLGGLDFCHGFRRARVDRLRLLTGPFLGFIRRDRSVHSRVVSERLFRDLLILSRFVQFRLGGAFLFLTSSPDFLGAEDHDLGSLIDGSDGGAGIGPAAVRAGGDGDRP